MAKFRKIAFVHDSDWELNKWGTSFESRLENGHVLFVTGPPRDRPEMGWQWGIYDKNHPDPDIRAYPVRKGGQLWGGESPDDPSDHLPTAEHAKRQAIKNYKQMFPMGTDTGTHDSGVDYSDLNKIMREQGFQ